jgi:hypothetical protein
VRDERLDKPVILLGDVAVEERPDVIAAQRFVAFDQGELHLRPPLRQSEGDEPAGQASAQDRQRRARSHAPGLAERKRQSHSAWD